MTTYLVTRHEGTRRWVEIMSRQGKLPFQIDVSVEHIDSEQACKGDTVIGTLPIGVVARLRAKGVHFWSLDIDVPPSDRGKELSATQLATFGARLTRYEVREKETEAVRGQAEQVTITPQPAIALIAVSEQLAPAAIGWLHHPTREVLLLYSEIMRSRAKVLKKWLESRSNSPVIEMRHWDDTNYATLLNGAEQWADHLAQQNRQMVVVNLTGGTKLMSMALQRAFGKRAHVFHGGLMTPYIDTEHRRIEDLLNPTSVDNDMRSALNIQDVFLLQGIDVLSATSSCSGFKRWLERKSLFDVLLHKSSEEWIGWWYRVTDLANWLVDERKNKNGSRTLSSDFYTATWTGSRTHPSFKIATKSGADPGWRKLKRAFEGEFGKALTECGVLTWAFDGKDNGLTIELSRNPLDELAFIAGGWMETWLTAQFNETSVDDLAQGVQFAGKAGKLNELDLVAVCGNRTLLVEVKTANLRNDGREDSKATESVYKLSAVADQIAHTFSDRWLVSLRPTDKGDRERANKQHQIKVFDIHSGEVEILRRAIHEWVARSRIERLPGYARSVLPAPNAGQSQLRSSAIADQLREAIARK